MVFINELYSSGVEISADMRNDAFIDPGENGSLARWEGIIYFLSIDDGQGNEPTGFCASATITFRLEDSVWYVYRWEDLIGESDPNDPGRVFSSMGELRGIYGS